MGIGVFSRYVGGLSAKRQVVALGSESDSHLAAKEDKGEHISILVTAAKEELVWVHAVGDGRSDPWEDMEDNWGLVLVLWEELALAQSS